MKRGNRVVAAFSWKDKRNLRHERAQAFKLSEGKIVAMQDYKDPAIAALATRLRTALTS